MKLVSLGMLLMAFQIIAAKNQVSRQHAAGTSLDTVPKRITSVSIVPGSSPDTTVMSSTATTTTIMIKTPIAGTTKFKTVTKTIPKLKKEPGKATGYPR